MLCCTRRHLTPFETGFTEGEIGWRCWTDPWFVINRVLDVIFLFDMILQFFVAYQTGNAYGGWTWVEDHNKIMRHYLCSWFVIDATTVFLPLSFDLYLASLLMSRRRECRLQDDLPMMPHLQARPPCTCVTTLSEMEGEDYPLLRLTDGPTMPLYATLWYALVCMHPSEATLHTVYRIRGVGLYGLCDDHLTTAVFEWHGGVLPWEGDGAGPLAGCERLGLPSFYLSAITMGLLSSSPQQALDYYNPTMRHLSSLVLVWLWTMIIAAFVDVAAN